jgi:hypothetical protein
MWAIIVTQPYKPSLNPGGRVLNPLSVTTLDPIDE